MLHNDGEQASWVPVRTVKRWFPYERRTVSTPDASDSAPSNQAFELGKGMPADANRSGTSDRC